MLNNMANMDSKKGYVEMLNMETQRKKRKEQAIEPTVAKNKFGNENLQRFEDKTCLEIENDKRSNSSEKPRMRSLLNEDGEEAKKPRKFPSLQSSKT